MTQFGVRASIVAVVVVAKPGCALLRTFRTFRRRGGAKRQEQHGSRRRAAPHATGESVGRVEAVALCGEAVGGRVDRPSGR